MTNNFYKAILSEQYKLSKNKEIFGILLIPAVIIIFIALYITYDLTSAPISENGYNPWKLLLGRYVFLFFYILYPILVSLFVHACCDVEFKNNNYKILFTLPISKSNIFLSKVMYILFTILLSNLISYIFFLLCGYILGISFPETGFLDYDYREVIFYTFLKFYIALSAIAMIQFALSLLLRNFLYPIGFSVLMLLFSGLINEKKIADFLVYTGGYKSYSNLLGENIIFERLDYCNMAAIFIFAFGSYIIFSKTKRS